jgi:two-component system OmpR family sensor kinase
MSSSPPSSRRGPWSLRAKLTAQMVAVVALVCLILGLVTELALQPFLVAQLDRQLDQASHREQDFAAGRRGPPDGGPPPEGAPPPRQPPPNAPVQGPGTISARIVGGQVVDAHWLNTSGTQQTLPENLHGVLSGLPASRPPGPPRPTTRDLGDLGSYRLTAVTLPNGDTLITGLPLSTVYDTLIIVGLILGGVSLVALAAAFAGATVIVRRTLRPLQRVAATAGRVAELPLDRGEVALSVRVPDADTDPRTEVGQVGSALNRMLGHIGNALQARHASETRMRRFIADASHELRTPLAAIRGYAELTRRSRDEVPADVAHAMRRVESESARMTTLVEDLLLLARLDAGRPVEAEQVDLSRIVLDAVSDSRIAGPDHRWRLDLPAEPVHVTGDAARLHQVLVNLLANARTHTPPGTTVTTTVRSTRDSAILTVADDGPGIPPDLLPEVFERFARGDTSRSRAAGSTGLGLSIVAAVVAAHHGAVEVESTPGNTTFTVTLPG